MPCPHFSMSIASRGKGCSAVAGAAYQSGERLFDERSNHIKDYTRKRGVEYSEIILPEHAPPEYSDRGTLWNAVEAAEPNWNSQLARRIIMALPREISQEENIRMLREYVKKQFVDKGMIADIAVHDPYPPGHNPHAHVMLTMRSMDEQGKWLPKCRKEYVLDENGDRIRLKSGRWKTYKVDLVDWNKRTNCELWRHEWEVIQNRFLEENGREERVCLKSYERQGKERIPTVHMGPAVAAMEKKGVHTNIGDLNRDIQHTNRLIELIKELIQKLFLWMADTKVAIAEIEYEAGEIFLADLLVMKFEERKEEILRNQDTDHADLIDSIMDDGRFTEIMGFMRENELLTVQDLDDHLKSMKQVMSVMNKKVAQSQKEIEAIEELTEKMERHVALQPVRDEYLKIHWKKKKEQYAKDHKAELAEWKVCDSFIKKYYPDIDIMPDELKEEKEAVGTELEVATKMADDYRKKLEMLNEIRMLVTELVPELIPEKEETAPQRKEERRSVVDKLHQRQDAIRQRESKKSLSTSQQKSKQDMSI